MLKHLNYAGSPGLTRRGQSSRAGTGAGIPLAARDEAGYTSRMKNVLSSSPLPKGLLREHVLPPAIMVLGTASNAGKSLLAAGLCRAFARRGLSVAPFKAQNLALNSAVTPGGGEIGRAQALQAQACGLLPDERMNPVLLKPEAAGGCQLVVLGRARGHCGVREYAALKPGLFGEVCDAYASLAAGRDIMILEGAGSPSEINLKATDIVNTRMAAEARARVLLAGDIDRGGVFAALVGTLELMDPWERDLVAGLVITKFRGDPSLLTPALAEISTRTGKPFVGVMPWLDRLDLPEEDSVGLRAGLVLPSGPTAALAPDELDVVVIDLPRVGNIVDVDPLVAEPGVRPRLVARPEDLGKPDLIVVPGSKSTAADLRFIRASGLAAAVAALNAAPGGPDLLGICGGLQMLGLRIEDPLGLEEAPGHVETGLGLLPVVTRMDAAKTLRRATCRDVLSGLSLAGYEIHHGRTAPDPAAAPGACVPWMTGPDGVPMGWRRAPLAPGAGPVWGTYAHGLFDDDAWRCAWLNDLRERRGKPRRPVSRFSLEPGLNKLADAVEHHLDLDSLSEGMFRRD